MAWLTVIGPDQGQVDYRLEASAGCAHPEHEHDLEHGRERDVERGREQGAQNEHQVHAAEAECKADRSAERDARVDYQMDPATRLEWFGGGLAEVDIAAGTAIATEADKAMARALMDGRHPRPEPGPGGKTEPVQLVTPKRAAHPASLVTAAPVLAALTELAAERGVPVAKLARTVWGAKRIGRLARMVARQGEGHAAPVGDLERIAAEAGLTLEELYPGKELVRARAHRGQTVRVGERGFDLTLDLPKSASVLWALGRPEISQPIEDAFRDAVRETLTDLEKWASYGMRGRHGEGKTADRVQTSGFLGWIMWHDVARPVGADVADPQLHAHCVIAHLSRQLSDDPDRDVAAGWGTIAGGGRDLHRHVQLAGALVQARFRAKTTALGFVWERRPGETWELAGVPREIRQVYSKRSVQTDDKLRQWKVDPATATTAQRKAASGASKQTKRTAPSPGATRTAREGQGVGRDAAVTASARSRRPRPEDPLRAAWWDQTEHPDVAIDIEAMERAARPGDGPSGAPATGPGGPTPPLAPTPARLAGTLLAPEVGLTAHAKVVARTTLMAAIADQLPAGVTSVAELERLADAVVALEGGPMQRLRPAPGTTVLSNHDRYTTSDITAAEHVVTSRARHGLRAGRAVVADDIAQAAIEVFEASRGFALSGEQRAVVTRLTGGGQAVDAIVGVAGAGKTTLMAAARTAWQAAELTVRGATTAAVAAQTLQTEAGIPSTTIAGLLHAIARPTPEQPGLDGVDVLVVDEAAMVDDRELARLADAAHQAGTKVVLIGDPKQLRAIGVGGTFAAVHRITDGPTLTENRRQIDVDERRALALWRTGDRAGALRIWSHTGRLHVGDSRADAIERLVSDWTTARSTVAKVYADLHRTAPGQRLDVHDELAEVLVLAKTNTDVDALNTAIRQVRRAAGEITGDDRLYPRPSDGGELALAVGDHVRVRNNDWRTRRHDAGPEDVDVLNGYRGVVTGFTGPYGRDAVIQWRRDTADGPRLQNATITADRIAAGDLTGGTALTVAAAQGQTGSVCLVYGPGMNGHDLYPAMSRDRTRATLYLPLAELETDSDRARHGTPTGAAQMRARAVAAYAPTLNDRDDTLITPDLATPEHHDGQRGGVQGQDVERQDVEHQTLAEGETERDRLAAETHDLGEQLVERQQEQARQAMAAAPWWTRTHGDRTPTELEKLRAQAMREVALHTALARHLTAETARADHGDGPASATLAERRQVLHQATTAAARAEELNTWLWEAEQRSTARRAERASLKTQLERNPVALRMRGTSRPELRTRIAHLDAEDRQERGQVDAVHRELRRLLTEAGHPYRAEAPQIPDRVRDRVEDRGWRTLGWQYRGGAAAELAHLDHHADAWQAAARADDRATAPHRALEAAHTQIDGPHHPDLPPWHAWPRSRVPDLNTAHAHLDTVTAEIDHRAGLPPLAQHTEDTQRGQHRRQVAAERRLQQQLRAQQQATQERHRGYRPPGPERGGPSFGR